MLDAIKGFWFRRRQGFVRSATFIWGSYAVSAYVSERLEEVKDKTLRDKLARENLRRRFQSTHDDVCFTIMALIPTLASQILEDMDVEALTHELQSLSRASRPRTLQPPHNQPRSQSVSETSTVSDAHSDSGSLSFSSGFDGDRASVTSGSWVEHLSASQAPIPRPDIPAQLSDSFTSAGSSLGHNTENSTTSTGSRTKSQLWNEVKILALTRTLTTLYTITLLSLFTAVQLNILGRSRYIDSVRASDRAERARDDIPDFSLSGILAREAMAKIVDVEAIWPAWILGETVEGEDEDKVLDAIPEETELRFLTLSWWVLHVGWKDVAARVRNSVESVFEDVSLKAKLSASELFALIMDVRRRVEMDGSGSKLNTRFLSSLLPPTPETTAHVLARGGALSIPRDNQSHNNIEQLLAKNLDLSSVPGNVQPLSAPSDAPYDGLTRETAIPIGSPTVRPVAFPTSPTSQAHESDVSSRASQSPSNSVHLLPSASALLADIPHATSPARGGLEVGPQFDALLSETRRYLAGPDFSHALGCALDRATEVLMDSLRARVFVDGTSTMNVAEEAGVQPQAGDVVEGASLGQQDDVKVRLAGMLPGLARWCQLALNATPNELVDNVMAVREVSALEAIIMSDYEHRFPMIS